MVGGDPDTVVQQYSDTPRTAPLGELREGGKNDEESGEGGGGGGGGGRGNIELLSSEVSAEGHMEGEDMAMKDRGGDMEHPASGSRREGGPGEQGTGSELVDVEGDHGGEEELQDSDTPALFQPSSPLNLMPTGILHDIAEESEVDTELEHSWNTGEKGLMNAVRPGLMELEGVEYAETSFLDEGSFTSLTEPPPSLPLSLPPGPVLSPRLSMLLSDTGGAGSSTSDPSPALVATSEQYDLTNRLSVLSMSDEAPPPLPTTLPPGKLISPRHSMLVGSETIPSGMGTGLDFVLLSEQMDRVLEGREEGEGGERQGEMEGGTRADRGRGVEEGGVEEGGMEEGRVEEGGAEEGGVEGEPGTSSTELSSHAPEGQAQNGAIKHPELNRDTQQAEENEEPLLITNIDEVDEDLPPSKEALETLPPEEAIVVLPLTEEAIETLPPPTDSADEGTPQPRRKGTNLKFTPSFLRSLEPPREFSDSGFPDTDHETAQAPPKQGTCMCMSYCTVSISKLSSPLCNGMISTYI